MDDAYCLLHGDCRERMQSLHAESVDSIVTDPPYGLAFMGKDWDHGVPGVAFWTEALRVAKPGAHLLAFGGTRTHHRLACAIEDAGWEVRDCIMWVYGSGFPKSLDVSKAIDRQRDDFEDIAEVVRFLERSRIASGVTRRQVEDHFGTVNIGQAFFTLTPGSKPRVPMWDQWLSLKALLSFDDSMDAEVWRLNGRKGQPGEAWHMREVVGEGADGLGQGQFHGSKVEGGYGFSKEYAITAPATDAARQWAGWGTALKPAWEPIIVARKSLCGTVAENVLRYGTGGINVDACRVGKREREKFTDAKRVSAFGGDAQDYKNPRVYQRATVPLPPGRWPANVMHDGSEEATEPMGSAARFFYCAKASKADREDGNGHPTVKPTALMRYLCRLVTQPGGVVLDPFMGSGSTGKAAMLEGFRFIGIERDAEYVEIARRRIEAARIESPHGRNEPKPT